MPKMNNASFISDESGAVTVDWTVMTAAIAGLGIATYGVVSGGISNLSSDVAVQLGSQSIRTAFGELTFLDDFENGAAGWLGGVTDNTDPGYGGILGRFGGTNGAQTVSKIFELDTKKDYAVAVFDLHAIDSWDRETFTVFVDDTPISGHQFAWREAGVVGEWTSPDDNYTVTIEPTTERTQIGYSGWVDQSYEMRVTVRDPGEELKLGFGSNLNQSITDESWAIDNVAVTSTNTPDAL
jgi:Flp pilus assembly pilin Flp